MNLAEALAMPDEVEDLPLSIIMQKEKAYRTGYCHAYHIALLHAATKSREEMLEIAERIQNWRDALRIEEDSPQC
jgi:hypothetical protein